MTSSPTHEVACFKGKVALEVEWNNKTEFYDRDLNNFRLLFDLCIADAGIILRDVTSYKVYLTKLGRGASYGRTTTILSKLARKLDGGAGGGCPVLVIGMKKALFVDDIADPSAAVGFAPIARLIRKRSR